MNIRKFLLFLRAATGAERELLGLYLSGHPLDDYEDVLESSGADRIMELTEAADDTMTVAAGMVVSVEVDAPDETGQGYGVHGAGRPD